MKTRQIPRRQMTIYFATVALFVASVMAISSRCSAAEKGVYRDHVEPHWFDGDKKFWYRNQLSQEESEFVLVDADRATRSPAFDRAQVAAAISKLSGLKIDARHLPIVSLLFSDDGKSVRLDGVDGSWKLDLATYQVSAAAPDHSAATLPADLAPHASGESVRPTFIQFNNKTDQPAHLFWIDSKGQRIAYGEILPGQSRTQDTYVGHVWAVTGTGGELLGVYEGEIDRTRALIMAGVRRVHHRPASRRAPTDASLTSPDGKWLAFVKEDNLWVRGLPNGNEVQMSDHATKQDSYHADASRDRGINLDYNKPDAPASVPDVFWSADSRFVVAMRTHCVPEPRVYAVESSPSDQLQPKLTSYPYFKAGDPIPTQWPHLFDVAQRREVPIDPALFPTPWDINEVRWSKDSSQFTFLYLQRGCQNAKILAVSAADGHVTPIVDEKTGTFIDFSSKIFTDYEDPTHEIIWMSERDGWNHLYLYDAQTGRLKNQITKGPWVVRGVDEVDAKNRQIWFHASGIYPDQNPYYVHYCRINFDGTGLVTLTDGNGTHLVAYSPDHRYYLDTWSQVDVPPTVELRRSSGGEKVCELEKADISELQKSGWLPPIQFAAKGRDGKTDIFGVIYRPLNWDPAKTYPVLEDVYAGPHGSFVQESFRARLQDRDLTQRGFAVVQADGMGTSNRSRAFHDVCWKNIQDAGFADRILWMKAAAKKYPWLDIARVGIFGTSAGGQDAMIALEQHGDFYKAAVADCGCYDNRMDKIWWNEQWMGWPVGPEYEQQSCVTNASKLRGKLLLIGCEMDHNVDPATTMQMVNALIKADKDFDLLIVPGADHGGDGAYGQRRRAAFFTRNLLVTP